MKQDLQVIDADVHPWVPGGIEELEPYIFHREVQRICTRSDLHRMTRLESLASSRDNTTACVKTRSIGNIFNSNRERKLRSVMKAGACLLLRQADQG